MTTPIIIKNLLFNNKNTFTVALKAGDNVDLVNNYILGVVNTITLNPEILKCTPESIKDAAITSATLGIPIDARKLAYLIPYRDKAQFQLSYKGYVHIAKRDVEVDNVVSNIVYKDDKFEIDLGNNQLSHVPDLESPNYGKEEAIKFVYALVKFRKNTGRDNQFEVMTKAQIDEIKQSSKTGGAIWSKWYSEMARKTVIKRLCKHAQLGDISRFDEVDNAPEQDRIINVTPNEVQTEDFITQDKNKLIEAIEACQSESDLQNFSQKNSEKLEEIACYNVSASKEISKAYKDKADDVYIENLKELLSDCLDEISLDKVYNNHERKIEHLKAAKRDDVINYYIEIKNGFMDAKVN